MEQSSLYKIMPNTANSYGQFVDPRLAQKVGGQATKSVAGDAVKNAGKAAMQFYLPGLISAQDKFNKGDMGQAAYSLGSEANQLPVLRYKLQATKNLLGKLVDTSAKSIEADPVVSGKNAANSLVNQNMTNPLYNPANAANKGSNSSDFMKLLYNPNYQELGAGKKKLSEFSFFKGTFIEEKMKKSMLGRAILKTDKNLLDSKLVRNGFEKVFKGSLINTETQVAKNGFKNVKVIEGVGKSVPGSGAKFVAETLGRVPVLGVVISSLIEIPNIVKAFKNGDGKQQIGRSSLNIAGVTAGSAILGSLMLPLIPPLGGLIGAIAGGMIGGKIADIAGERILGKSIADQKDDAKNQMKQAQNIFKQNQQLANAYAHR